jgi:hypothetical protein
VVLGRWTEGLGLLDVSWREGREVAGGGGGTNSDRVAVMIPREGWDCDSPDHLSHSFRGSEWYAAKDEEAGEEEGWPIVGTSLESP